MSETEEVAEAVQEVAKFGQRGLESAEKLGSFLIKALGEPGREVVGMITDKLRFVRWKGMLRTADEVNRILDERAVTETRAVPPKIALPIVEESSLETDDHLHAMWNHLLANAMDPNFKAEIRYAYIEIIKNLTAADARLLQRLYSDWQSNLAKSRRRARGWALFEVPDLPAAARSADDPRREPFDYEEIVSFLDMDEGGFALSIDNLMRLQLIATFYGGAHPSTFHDFKEVKYGSDSHSTGAFSLTAFGVKFVEACGKS